VNNLIYITHAFSCFFMTGLIWLIQCIHYPSYKYIDPTKFSTYQNFHTTTITFIVGPVMVLEIFTGMSILFDQKLNALSSVNFIGLVLIWLATAFFSVPLHGKLSLGYDAVTIHSLISTNWIRTFFWTTRSFLIIYFMFQAFKKDA
jgi:hypothetical protein